MSHPVFSLSQALVAAGRSPSPYRRLQQVLTTPSGISIGTPGSGRCQGYTVCSDLVPPTGCGPNKQVEALITGTIATFKCGPCPASGCPPTSPPSPTPTADAPPSTPPDTRGVTVGITVSALDQICDGLSLSDTGELIGDVPPATPILSFVSGGANSSSSSTSGSSSSSSSISTVIAGSGGDAQTVSSVLGPDSCPPGTSSQSMVNGQLFCDGQPTAIPTVASCPEDAKTKATVQGQLFCDGKLVVGEGGTSTSSSLGAGSVPGSSLVLVDGKVAFLDGNRVEVVPQSIQTLAEQKEGDACPCVAKVNDLTSRSTFAGNVDGAGKCVCPEDQRKVEGGDVTVRTVLTELRCLSYLRWRAQQEREVGAPQAE